MNESKWWSYVSKTTGNEKIREIADKVGIDKSNVSRWSNGSRPAADFAVSFARAYGRPVAEALAAASYITEEEANLRTVTIGLDEALSSATTTDLLEVLLRRARGEGATPTPPAAANVGGERETVDPPRQRDFDLVAHPYTEETGELMDE